MFFQSGRLTAASLYITAAASPEHIRQELPWPLRLLLRASKVCRFVSSWRKKGMREWPASGNSSTQQIRGEPVKKKTNKHLGWQENYNKQEQRGAFDAENRALEGRIRSNDQLVSLLRRWTLRTGNNISSASLTAAKSTQAKLSDCISDLT